MDATLNMEVEESTLDETEFLDPERRDEAFFRLSRCDGSDRTTLAAFGLNTYQLGAYCSLELEPPRMTTTPSVIVDSYGLWSPDRLEYLRFRCFCGTSTTHLQPTLRRFGLEMSRATFRNGDKTNAVTLEAPTPSIEVRQGHFDQQNVIGVVSMVLAVKLRGRNFWQIRKA